MGSSHHHKCEMFLKKSPNVCCKNTAKFLVKYHDNDTLNKRCCGIHIKSFLKKHQSKYYNVFLLMPNGEQKTYYHPALVQKPYDSYEDLFLVYYKQFKMLIEWLFYRIQEDCPICLETLNWYNRCRLAQCKHKFHKKCINKWLSKNKTCPLCRKTVHN